MRPRKILQIQALQKKQCCTFFAMTYIFETFCEPCEDYDTKSSLCRHCGCRVNRQAAAPLNKIAMATEECLLGKWDTIRDGRLQQRKQKVGGLHVYPRQCQRVRTGIERGTLVQRGD
jgi:hypothetical protein